ncbi:MAG TPA: alpha-hydroxy-acid oxidizing protein, partial [Candidatus Dojkabacteria bacterium]|nr:alpha-hydroxy-acid oxidizing protein [Candidatus Dojkabacteria bacterium]
KHTKLKLIAGGGIRNGLHIAKALSLGADLATAAKPLLKPALQSPEACLAWFAKIQIQLKTAMFCAGYQNIRQLRKLKLSLISNGNY